MHVYVSSALLANKLLPIEYFFLFGWLFLESILTQFFYTSFIGNYKIADALIIIHSYGGMLTAWIKFKYPNLVDGGLAASAPIFYTEGLVSRTAFFGKVTEVSIGMYT